MTLTEMWAWIYANPVVVLAIVAWVVANVAQRPLPSETQSRGTRLFWLVVDRISVLTAEKVPGKLKWLMAPSPLPGESKGGGAEPDSLPENLPRVTDPGDKSPPEKGSL